MGQKESSEVEQKSQNAMEDFKPLASCCSSFSCMSYNYVFFLSSVVGLTLQSEARRLHNPLPELSDSLNP